MKKRFWIVCSILITLAISGGFTFHLVNSIFTSERWMNHMDVRYKMIDSLEKKHPLKGKTAQDTIALLGNPDNTWEHDFEEEHYIFFQYYIGPSDRKFAIMQEPNVYLVVFCDGVVVNTSVQPT